MTFEQFQATLSTSSPPPGLGPVLVAMWHDGRGDWDAAHTVAQDVAGPDGAWVHAYLHRKEGDRANAAYWYRRAGRPPAQGPLESEWREIVDKLLRSHGAARS